MNRQEFLDRLAYLLGDLREEDRDEAVRYYQDYFDDAGEENEEDVIAKLGSPEKVAATIRQDMAGADPLAGEFSETGYNDPRFSEHKEIIPAGRADDRSASGGYTGAYSGSRQTGREERTYGNGGDAPYGQPSGKKEMNLATKVVIGACIFFGALVHLPAAGGIVGGIGGIFAAVAAALFSVAAAGIALIVSGVLCFFTGIAGMVSGSFGTGLFYIGGSLITVAAGILLTMFGVWLLSKIIPAVIRFIVRTVRRIFHKEEVNGQ